MKYQSLAFLLSFSAATLSAFAVEEEYGFTPEETYQQLQENAEEILFVDVRDPVEIQFIGFTDLIDVNIPFLLVDREQWDEEKTRFVMRRNGDFVRLVREALQEKGLGEDAMIITMCRSGSSRGQPSAALLREKGLPNSYFVINGFQGDPVSEGLLKGFRLKNGWQNAGLPWGWKINGAKIAKP